ncbi:MAG: PqiC family protein, partial [Candidatus Binatia bacterium]
MHSVNSVVFFFGFACLSVSGCMNFSPMSDPSRFFMLNPLPQSEQSRPDTDKVNSLFLGIGPIRFPAYLDRDQIVTRAGQNRFDVSENDRWAEPLE